MRIRKRAAGPSADIFPAAPTLPSPEKEAAPPFAAVSSVVGFVRSSHVENVQIHVSAEGKHEKGLLPQVVSSTKVEEGEKKDAVICKKGDGKGWQCKREARRGHSLCDYHLEKLRSYGCYARRKKTKADPTAGGSPDEGNLRRAPPPAEEKRRRRSDRQQKTPRRLSDSFYYYSGFGPLWRKRRGGRADDGAAALPPPQLPDEEEDGGEEGKPVKSRPLSSIF